MKKTKTNILTSFAAILVLAFSIMLLYSGKAYAQNNYFNNYYASVNGGMTLITPGGVTLITPTEFSSKSGGTANISLGKNYNFNNYIIGDEVSLGYENSHSWTVNNFDGYGDNTTLTLHSIYYIAAIKAGYAMNNIMPFVKLGYIGDEYNASASFSGPYSNLYGSMSHNSYEGGLLYGIGVEYMLNQNWGMQAQYSNALLAGKDRMENFTLGISYNF